MLGRGGKVTFGTVGKVGMVGMLGSGGSVGLGRDGWVVGKVGNVGCGRFGIEGNGGIGILGNGGNWRRWRAAMLTFMLENVRAMNKAKIKLLQEAITRIQDTILVITRNVGQISCSIRLVWEC